jgi:MoxR-like ATPase
MNTIFDPNAARDQVHQSIALFNKYVKGMSSIGTLMISSAIQGGVCSFLGQGEPGGGKTRAAEVIAVIIGGKTFLVQGTPDLQPKDIMGSEWLDMVDGKPTWKVSWSGMRNANIVVGDEFNRMDTRTQATFMSPMSEGRCTMMAPHVPAEQAVSMMHPVRVFLCVQNDVGSEGTNPLPPAQYDRFLYMVNFDRIGREAEEELLTDDSLGDREVLERVAEERVLSLETILEVRKWIRANMYVHERFIKYQLSVIRATVPGTPEFKALRNKHPEIRPILDSVKSGVSVRGNMALKRACQVRAFLFGKEKDGVTPRNFVMPEDLNALAHSVMDHRIVMNDRAATRVVAPNAIWEQWVKTFNRTKHADDRTEFDFPTDGTITREEIVARLNCPGKNPILPSHMADVALAYTDFTADPSAFSR